MESSIFSMTKDAHRLLSFVSPHGKPHAISLTNGSGVVLTSIVQGHQMDFFVLSIEETCWEVPNDKETHRYRCLLADDELIIEMGICVEGSKARTFGAGQTYIKLPKNGEPAYWVFKDKNYTTHCISEYISLVIDGEPWDALKVMRKKICDDNVIIDDKFDVEFYVYGMGLFARKKNDSSSAPVAFNPVESGRKSSSNDLPIQ